MKPERDRCPNCKNGLHPPPPNLEVGAACYCPICDANLVVVVVSEERWWRWTGKLCREWMARDGREVSIYKGNRGMNG